VLELFPLRHLQRSLVVVVAALAGMALMGCNQILGIGDPQLDPSGSGGSGQGGAATGVGGTSTGDGGSGGGPPPPCAPTDPICNQVDSDCIALYDNAGRDKFGLRVQQTTIFKPDAFASGLEYSAIVQSMTMNLPECYLAGGGTINWLVELDLTTDTARVGGSKPVADPFQGYSFVDEMVEVDTGVFLDVSPAEVTGTIEPDGSVATDTISSVTVPIYLDQAATSFIMVPVREARVYDGKLSADQNCVGSFNATELDPDKACLPEINKDIKSFVEGAKLEGYILLEEADDVIVTAFGLNRSLCVVLAQDVGEFGTGSNPTRCARKQNGEIKFPGDWCSATNAPWTPSCACCPTWISGRSWAPAWAA